VAARRRKRAKMQKVENLSVENYQPPEKWSLTKIREDYTEGLPSWGRKTMEKKETGR